MAFIIVGTDPELRSDVAERESDDFCRLRIEPQAANHQRRSRSPRRELQRVEPDAAATGHGGGEAVREVVVIPGGGVGGQRMQSPGGRKVIAEDADRIAH